MCAHLSETNETMLRTAHQCLKIDLNLSPIRKRLSQRWYNFRPNCLIHEERGELPKEIVVLRRLW